MKLLEGKVAMVTGASRGIGRAVALKLAGEGANVAFTYVNNKEKAEETLADLLALGVRAKVYRCDGSDFEATQKCVAQVAQDFGRIDILVNNAGKTADTLVMRMSEQQWDDVLDTNLKSVFNAIRACIPLMMRQRSGSIINMSSVVGVYGNAGQVNYAASKAGLVGLTKSVAKEVGSRGIRVNAIAPGFIETEMTASLSEEIRKTATQSIALKRMGSVDDVANCVLFLASDMSAYVSAQVLLCDGGM